MLRATTLTHDTNLQTEICMKAQAVTAGRRTLTMQFDGRTRDAATSHTVRSAGVPSHMKLHKQAHRLTFGTADIPNEMIVCCFNPNHWMQAL